MTSADEESSAPSIDDDEPITVAFHDSPDETSPPTPTSSTAPPDPFTPPTPRPQTQRSAAPAWEAKEEKDESASRSVGGSTAVVMSTSHSVAIMPANLPTIKAVNINAILPAPPNPAAPTTYVFPAPSTSSIATRAVLDSIASAALTSSHLYSPSSHPSPGRISAYAVSLLSSGSIFRYYRLNTASSQIEFQDIKLFALFPAHLTQATPNHNHTTASPARLPSGPSLPSEPTLYWGPPNTRTSTPSTLALPLMSITDIYRGKKSPLFHSHSPLVALLSTSRCFTIASATTSLNLEAVTEQIREEWIVRIVEIIRVMGKKLEVAKDEQEDGQEQQTRVEQEKRERKKSLTPTQSIVITPATQPQQVHPSSTTLPPTHPSSSSLSVSVVSTSTPPSSASKNSDTSLSLSIPPSPYPESTLTNTLSSSFLFRNMHVVTKERTAREKLEITFDMRFTLREMVHSAAAFLHSREGVNGGRVDSMEFTMTEKRSTTHLPTADHPSSNFEFKAYAGSIFSRLRWFYGVLDDDYLQSVAGDSGYTDFIANSKSGSFFFYTYDKAYMIKSMTKEESEFLRVSVLPSYYHHLTVYRDSLLSKIFGLYRIRKRTMSHPVYFMVMRNVFYTEKPIHMRFDLKGSTLGRKATEREKEQETPVLKDMDFLHGAKVGGQEMPPMWLRLGMKKRAVLGQLEVDAKYLERLEIMDYSLLVGVHWKDRAKREEREEREKAERERRKGRVRRVRERQQNYGTKKHEVVIPRGVMQKVATKMASAEIEKESKQGRKRVGSIPDLDLQQLQQAQAGSATATNGAGGTGGAAQNELKQVEEETGGAGGDSGHSSDDEYDLDAPPTPTSQPFSAARMSRPGLLRVSSSTFFTQDDGGLCSVDPLTGREGNEVYYLGIIDILQRYNARKKVEHGVKALTHDANAVSCAPPSFYAERFLKAIGERMVGVDNSLHWSAGPASAAHTRGESLSLEEFIQSGGVAEGEAGSTGGQ